MLGQALKAIYKATLPTLAADEQHALLADASGRLRIASEADLAAIAAQAVSTDPVPVYEGWDRGRITTSTTTVLKTGAGTMGDVFFTAIGSSATVEFFDALTATNSLLKLQGGVVAAGRVALPHLRFYTGLTVVTTGAPDVTVAYL